MKLTTEEYLKILHRRNEIELTTDEIQFIKDERMAAHTEWSTYLHYLKKIILNKSDHFEIAEKVLIAGKALKVEDIDIDKFQEMTIGYSKEQYPEIAYIVSQIINTYRYPVTEPKVADIPPL